MQKRQTGYSVPPGDWAIDDPRHRARRIELACARLRELLNISQADSIGCYIITVTADILARLPTVGRNLGGFSLDTVKMFQADAERVRFTF